MRVTFLQAAEDTDMICAVLLSALLVAALLLVRWRKKKFCVFKELGVDGPAPNLIWGNLFEYQRKKRVPALSEWCNTYGDIFGFYNGDVPTLVVKDLDLLQRIFVKDFSRFTNRGCTMRTDQEHPHLGHTIAHAKGQQWKKVRSYVSQGFTSSKLKQMIPHIRHVADLFLEVLDEKADTGKEVSMTELFQGLSMDYVGRAAFGIDNSFQRDLNNPFMTQARQTMHGVMTGFFHNLAQETAQDPVLSEVYRCLLEGHVTAQGKPELGPYLQRENCTTTLGPLMTPPLWLNAKLGSFTFEALSRQTAKVVKLRKQDPSLWKPDLVQGLIDAENRDNAEDSPTKGDVKKLSSADVCFNAAILFIAGVYMKWRGPTVGRRSNQSRSSMC